MIDPIDKPGKRTKTFERIQNFLIKHMFIHGIEVVDNGCAISMIEILENVFPEMLTSEGNAKILPIFIEPLLALF